MITQALPKSPPDIWQLIRHGEYDAVTGSLAPGYVQANLVVLPKAQAFDFLLFCQRNPRPCPLIEVMDSGQFEPKLTSAGSDIRTDVPRYRIFRHGELVDEVTDIQSLWNDDLVSFLLGCSFTFESALVEAGIPLWHWETGKNVTMFKTNISTVPAGGFSGPMVVSMRPIHHTKIVRAVQVTSRFPGAHGAPIHVGDPQDIGIADVHQPDYGDASEFKEGQQPVFWACGVTPQAVALESKPPFMITHAPGYMYITNMRDTDLAAL